MLVRGPIHEVVRQIGPGLRSDLDVVDRQVQLLEGETANLANHAGDHLVRRVREGVALGPGRQSQNALLDTQEAVGIKAQGARSQVAERVQRITDDHAHAGKCWVEPVDRRLTLLEVVQVHPSALDAIGTGDRRGGAPVRVLHPGLVEDHPLQLADDVAALVELVLGLGVGDQPRIPPARLTGPVWSPWIPMRWNASHSSRSPSVARNEQPGLPRTEMGYAVNQTDAVWIAARGSGLAKGFWNMLPWPENCLAMALASWSIDWRRSHSTYAGFEPTGSPSCSAGRTCPPRRRALGRRCRGRAG